VSVLALALATVAAEVAVRATDLFGISYYKDVNRYFNGAIRLVPGAMNAQGRIFENKPSVDLGLVRFHFKTDAGGFRASDPHAPFEPRRDPGRGRILFLGDSVTLAWGVEDEDAWIRLVERDARDRAGRPVQCLNAGHLSYDSVQEADWLAAHGPDLRPDAVVLTYVVNDFESTWEQYKDFLGGGEGIVRPKVTWRDEMHATVVTRFRGLYGLWHLFEERRNLDHRPPGELDVESEPVFVEGWPRSEKALDRILAICGELGAPLVLLDHTTPRIPAVRRWCEAHGVAVFDFTFTAEEEARGVRNSLADAHANELGQTLLAAKARAALRAVGVLAP